MPLHLASGRANQSLRSSIAGFAARFEEILVIAPRLLAGEGFYERTSLEKEGAAGIHRMTLIGLARELAAPAIANAGLTPISALGLEAIAAQLTHRAIENRELHYFAPVAGLPGFARALARTISELRLAGITAEDLRAETKDGNGDGDAPGDLAMLLEAYEDALREASLIDLADLLRIAREAAEKTGEEPGATPNPWAHLPVAMLDPDLSAGAHAAFAKAVLQRAPEALLVRHAAEPERLGDRVAGAEISIEDPAQEAHLLTHLRRQLFSPESAAFSGPPNDETFELFSAPGEGLETVEIARRIHRLARTGEHFDGIAILLRDPNRYQAPLEDALHRAGIPAYFSRGTRRPDPAGRAFLALLECAGERLSASRFAEYLSLGQTPVNDSTQSGQERAGAPKGAGPPKWMGPEDEVLAPLTGAEQTSIEDTEPVTQQAAEAPAVRAPWGWEKLIVDAGVIGGADRWKSRLKGLAAEWELQLSSFESGGGAATPDQVAIDGLKRRLEQLGELERFALPLIEQLDGLPERALWGDWLTRLGQLAEIALRNPDGVLTVLAELNPMAEVGPVGLQEVLQVLGERLRFLRVTPPGRRWGRVFVGSIEEARGRSFHTVFLPGLAEGLFPQRAQEDPLLLDAFRRALPEKMTLRADQAAEERLHLHRAIAAAGHRLIASYPRMDVAEARPRVPSFYALELPRAVAGTLPDLKEFEERARKACPARLNWPAPEHRADAIDDAEYDLAAIAAGGGKRGAVHYLMNANQNVARSLRMRFKRWEDPRWSDSDGLLSTRDDVLAVLTAQGLTARPWSPSALEQFARCPYRFALSGILKLAPREVPEAVEQMDPRTRGSLFHKAQDELYQVLQAAELLPVNRDRLAEALDHCDEVLSQVAERYREDLAPALPRVWDSEIADLRADLRGWLHYVAHNEYDWEPIEFEKSFGRDGDAEPATNQDDDGADDDSAVDSDALKGVLIDEGFRLRGRIDVVEKNVDSGALRVTDHKTGKRPDPIPKWVGGGKNLQPLLYALAAEKLFGKPVEEGRLLYATQRGDYTPVRIEVNPRARLFLRQLALDIDQSITGAFLPAAPERDACKICNYQAVCGPYEEERFRKKNRHDERLEPLHEIRGMA